MKTLLCCLLFPAALVAQRSAFLKNPDIVWAAAVSQDWVVDIPSLDQEWDYGLTTVKLLRTERNEAYWADPFLTGLVVEAAKNRQLAIYQDPACTKPAAPEQVLYRRDTVVTFDPETYEEKVQVVTSEMLSTSGVKAWRLLQVLTYNRKSATWSTTVEAVAPLFVVRSIYGDSIDTRPLFWFRPDNKRPKLNSESVVWAKKTVTRQPGTAVPAMPAYPVKISEGYRNPLEHLLRVMGENKKMSFYDSWNEKPLSASARNAILVKTDTIVTFDPETYEEKVQVVRNDLNVDNIRQLRLVQTWYWDERKHRLSICLDAVAPMMDVFDSMGNFRYQAPLFYRRAKK